MQTVANGDRSRRSSCVEALPAAAGKAWLPTPHREKPWPRPRTDNRALAKLRGRCRGAAVRPATVPGSSAPRRRAAARAPAVQRTPALALCGPPRTRLVRLDTSLRLRGWLLGNTDAAGAPLVLR